MKHSTFVQRLIGSSLLEVDCYETVEADHHANMQALVVVLLANIGAALGSGVHSIGGNIALTITAIASWIVWVFLTVLIGTKLLPGEQTRADFGQVFRTTGFSAAPGILRVLGLIPVVGWLLFLLATIWMLLTFVIAVRQALDYTSTLRALAVCILGWCIHGLLLFGFVLTAV